MKKQTTKYIQYLLTLVGIIAIFYGVSQLWQSSLEIDPIDDGSLTLSEMDWDFGDISMADGDAVKEVLLANNSSSPVTITSMATSCMCTTVQVVHEDGSKGSIKGMVGHGGSPSMSEIIEAGEQASLIVTFDPNAHGPSATGPINRDVTIKTNSLDQPEINIEFSGNVTK